MPLFLAETDVEQLLDMPTTVEVVEEAFRQLHLRRATNQPRMRVEGSGIVLHSMSAAAEYLGLVGWKQYTTTKRGAKFHVGLYDQQTGEMIALLEADRLGQMRTGAVTGVAAKHLANPDVREVGLFGAGWQAESQLAAVCAVHPVERAFVYSRTPEKRTAFARRMTDNLNVDVIAVDEPRQAVEGLPIVITITTSRTPVFEGTWLTNGTLVCAAGSNWLHKRELDNAAFERSAAFVCDGVHECQIEAGDFFSAAEAGVFQPSMAIGLADVIGMHASPRKSPDDIIIFKSVGMAIEDVAVGGKVIELAKAAGIGRQLDL